MNWATSHRGTTVMGFIFHKLLSAFQGLYASIYMIQTGCTGYIGTG